MKAILNKLTLWRIGLLVGAVVMAVPTLHSATRAPSPYDSYEERREKNRDHFEKRVDGQREFRQDVRQTARSGGDVRNVYQEGYEKRKNWQKERVENAFE